MEIVSNGGHPATPSGVLARTTMATILLVAAIAALAITSLIQSNERATAQSGSVVQAAPSAMPIPLAVPLDSGEVGPFAFGHVEFDQNPAGGVPGFSSWPPSSPRQ